MPGSPLAKVIEISQMCHMIVSTSLIAQEWIKGVLLCCECHEVETRSQGRFHDKHFGQKFPLEKLPAADVDPPKLVRQKLEAFMVEFYLKEPVAVQIGTRIEEVLHLAKLATPEAWITVKQ